MSVECCTTALSASETGCRCGGGDRASKTVMLAGAVRVKTPALAGVAPVKNVKLAVGEPLKTTALPLEGVCVWTNVVDVVRV